MPTFSSLIGDTRNFIKNNFTIIILTIIGIAVFAQLVTYFFTPTIEADSQLKEFIAQITLQQQNFTSIDSIQQQISQLSDNEKQQLMMSGITYIFKYCLILLITNLITLSTIISLIKIIATKQFSWHNLLVNILQLTPQILLMILYGIPYFIVLLLVAPIFSGLAPFITLLAMFFYMLIFMVFAAVIIHSKQPRKFWGSLKISLKFAKQRIQLILSGLIIWLISATFLNSIFSLAAKNFVFNILDSVTENLLTFAILCYIYRLYSLTQQVEYNDTSY